MLQIDRNCSKTGGLLTFSSFWPFRCQNGRIVHFSFNLGRYDAILFLFWTWNVPDSLKSWRNGKNELFFHFGPFLIYVKVSIAMATSNYVILFLFVTIRDEHVADRWKSFQNGRIWPCFPFQTLLQHSFLLSRSKYCGELEIVLKWSNCIFFSFWTVFGLF